MNKTAIKNFAIWARVQLIEAAKQKAYEYGITENGEGKSDVESIGGRLLTKDEKEQRRQLVAQIQQKGYAQVMEEAAYTWFNRFIALRFMEVNGYLPSKIRVFTDEADTFKPEILKQAMAVDLDGLDRDKVLQLFDAQANEALYKYLLITQCNALHTGLPAMFEKIANWTELLFPANLLRSDSVIARMVSDIPKEDWQDAVQIIGWLYQYYNTELNAVVYDGNMSKSRIPKELLPAATTIYTPDWAIRYMVENSLGRLWLEGHPDAELRSGWKYYLDEAEQEPEVEAQLAKLREEYKTIKPEEIKVIDPCMGSGHILVYAFDVLMQIYTSAGWDQREAAQSILKNNLFGLDIDDRAAQLAYFAVMMKARQYDRRLLTRGIQPNICSIRESNGIQTMTIEYFHKNDPKLKADIERIVTEMRDAKEYGSILNITPVDFAGLYARFDEIRNDINMMQMSALDELLPLVKCAEVLAQKYDVVVTNPPYLGSSRFSTKLNDFVIANYPDVKADLSMVMYKHALRDMCKKNGFVSFITTTSWMFLSSFEKLRSFVLAGYDFESLVDFGTELFEGKVGHNPIVAWVNRKSHTDHAMTGIRLVDYCYSRRDEKELEFFNKRNYHYPKQSNFSKIPGSPVAYWLSLQTVDAFKAKKLYEVFEARNGITTGQNDLFIRYWYEVVPKSDKWFKCNKGGSFRRWYGNQEYVIDWENDGFRLKNFRDERGKQRSTLRSIEFNFAQAITMSRIGSGITSFRFLPNGFITEGASNNIYFKENWENLLAFLNSKVCDFILELYNPTINVMPDDLRNLPLTYLQASICCNHQVNKAVILSKTDWDSYETSWDFKRNPLAVSSIPAVFGAEYCGKYVTRLEDHYYAWKNECKERFENLQINEEELNRIFIDIYGLQDELTPDVADKDVTVHRVFTSRDDVPESMKGSNYVRTMRDEIVSLISYAVGCMFGRYSLDVDGLAYAGGEWDASKYKTIIPGSDNIIPICDDEYFDDDITGRFVEFVCKVYGDDTLEENLKFVADALGGKGTPREVIRSYFLNDFYADHLKTYQKRPIYWLFSSGKKNGFKALCYMHRYQRDLLARLRTDYVHEQQERYRTQIQMLEDSAGTASPSERVKLNKLVTKLKDQALEIQKYEEKVHHLADQMIAIDLDDGVKVNYAKFQDVLEKIK